MGQIPAVKAASLQQREVGRKRGLAAIVHIQAAEEQLDAAMRDICSVLGASADYAAIRKASEALKKVRETIAYKRIEDGQPSEYALEREPTQKDLINSHACGCYDGKNSICTMYTRAALAPAVDD